MASETTIRDRSAVDWALLVARVVVGVIFMAHGAQKLFGAFRRAGTFGRRPDDGTFRLPGHHRRILRAVWDSSSGFSRASLRRRSFSSCSEPSPWFTANSVFFMNWAGKEAGEGFEYHLLAIGALLPIVIAGPGRFAVGRFLPLPKVAGRERPVTVLE